MKSAMWIRLALMASMLGLSAPAVASPPVGTISTVTGNLAATDCINPEGLTVDWQGNFYTGSAKIAPVTFICKFDHNGTFVKKVPITAGPGHVTPLLGVHFEPPHTVFALDFADTLIPGGGKTNGRVLSVDMESGAVTTIASGFSFPNGFAEDLLGNLYVTDSFQGTITRMRQDGSNKTVWSADPLLAGNPAAPLPIGANGIAFDAFFQHLYVSNTSFRRIIRINVGPGWTAGASEIFADGAAIDGATGTALKGADGITFDLLGNLYVAANAANEIQVLSHSGQLTARYSNPNLVPPMDTTASPIFWGNQLFFTNLSLRTDATSGVNSSVAVLQAPLPGLPPL
jgi:sugar lactone lactonase YvrE